MKNLKLYLIICWCSSCAILHPNKILPVEPIYQVSYTMLQPCADSQFFDENDTHINAVMKVIVANDALYMDCKYKNAMWIKWYNTILLRMGKE
jgi:hypothetical protein